MTELKDTERLDLHSASSFDRTVNCPGWLNLFRAIPKVDYKPSTSPEAERGIRIHDARERMNPLELLDEGEVLAYERWLDLERQVVREWLSPFGDNAVWREGEREVRLWINNEETLEPECSARLDIHYVCGTHVLYVDGKTGAANYSGKAASNWQCKVTAVALKREYDSRSVTVSLVKPEAFPNGYSDTHTWHGDDLREVERQVLYHLAEARKPDAPRRAGPQCAWCPCKSHCPEALSMALLPTVVAQANPATTKDEIIARVATLGVADLVYLWQRRTTIKNVQDAVTERLKSQPKETLAEYGVWLSPGKDTSFVPGEKVKALAERFVAEGCPESEVWQCLEFSTEALNALALKVRGGTKKAATEWVKLTMADFKTEARGEKILREI